MSIENHEKYIKALTVSPKSSRKQEKGIKIFLSPEIINLLKDIKRLMELENNLAINSAIAYFYNNKLNLNEEQFQDYLSKKEGKSLEYTATPKNDQRIRDSIEKSKDSPEKMRNLIIISAIKVFHKVLTEPVMQ